jgi:UDP-3-O-[3-hydroxymyristoyl] N-acetylglucosamine deacetylase
MNRAREICWHKQSMRFETSIRGTVEVDGVGLHSGAPVHMRIVPAPPGTGIVFVRTDLNNYKIPASWEYVAKVSYATSLMRKSVLISTTEHLLSVFYSMCIDNAFVELDSLEVPILDGSGAPFVDLIREAGIQTSKRLRRYLRIVKPVEVETNGKRVAILPADQFELSCHALVGEQSLELEVSPETYANEIAPARTFGFEHELDAMRDQGLIRGASLENAVCFAQDHVANPGGLRFPDEPCRHKALDLIGDLALLGRPLLGRVVAYKAGHAMHAHLVKQIMSDSSLYRIMTYDQVKATTLQTALVS